MYLISCGISKLKFPKTKVFKNSKIEKMILEFILALQKYTKEKMLEKKLEKEALASGATNKKDIQRYIILQKLMYKEKEALGGIKLKVEYLDKGIKKEFVTKAVDFEKLYQQVENFINSKDFQDLDNSNKKAVIETLKFVFNFDLKD